MLHAAIVYKRVDVMMKILEYGTGMIVDYHLSHDCGKHFIVVCRNCSRSS